MIARQRSPIGTQTAMHKGRDSALFDRGNFITFGIPERINGLKHHPLTRFM
jgi:hypothetical protein